MDDLAEDLARRHTLRELQALESESIANGSISTTMAIIGLLFCAIGVSACQAKFPVLGSMIFALGAMNVLPAVFADLGPSTEVVREAITFKHRRLTPRS